MTTPSKFRRNLLLTCLFSVVVGATAQAQTQTWPERPVKIIVPFAAGGTTDALGRVIGQKLSEIWKQSVVVDYRTGAGGAVGAEFTAKSPADGYTMLIASGSMFTVNPFLYQKLPYSLKDFSPITNVASGPMLIVVNPGVPANSLKELVALAKSQPGKINFGSAGQGSQVHMAGEAFADAAGVEITHIPYKGESLAFNDLMGGQVQMMVGNIAAAAPYVKSGKLRALAVTGKERSSILPEVPTAAEAGLGNLDDVTGWFGFFMPAGTPQDIVTKVHQDTVKVLADPDTLARLTQQGMRPVGNTPKQLASAIGSESNKWEQVVKNRKLSVN